MTPPRFLKIECFEFLIFFHFSKLKVLLDFQSINKKNVINKNAFITSFQSYKQAKQSKITKILIYRIGFNQFCNHAA